jgi:hypothetical protein
MAGLETREADPLASGCSLPTKGVAQIRIANLVPSDTSADFCIRPSGTTDWGRPVMRNGGTGAICQAGMPYATVSVPFAVSAKKVDLKAIAAGGPCSEPATSEVDGVTLGPAVTTIARMGGGTAKVKEMIGAFPEEATPDKSGLAMRVINAMPGSAPIELGTATCQGTSCSNVSLPVNASAVLFERPVGFGEFESAGPTTTPYTVDKQGYMLFESGGFAFVLVPENDTKAVIAWYQPGGAFTRTMYAVGDPQDVAYAVRGLYCDDFAADSKNPLLASCTLTSLPNFTVDTVSLGLFGGNTTAETERKPLIYRTLQAEDADFVCVLEASEPDVNAQGIVALKTAGLSNVYNPPSQIGTPPTDPTDWNGSTPPTMLPNPPCAGNVPPSDFDAALMCAVNTCNTNTGSESGELLADYTCPGSTVCTPSSCLSSSCVGPFIPLVTSYPGCFNCMVENVLSFQTYAVMKANCTQSTLYPFAFNGADPVILASRFPFAKNADGSDATDVLFLPSTGYRRAVLHARVVPDALDPTKTVDFFCGYYTSPLLNGGLPYTGNYSKNMTYPDEPAPGTNGWRDEQNLQARRTVPFVKAHSTGPTIIAGDWHSSVHQPQNVTTPSSSTPWTVGDQSPEISEYFTSSQGGGFIPAHTAAWGYPCQFCPSVNSSNVNNPYDPPPAQQGVQGFDFLTTYLYGSGFSASSVTSESITNTAAIVQYDPANASLMGPISEYYARRIVLIRPQ